LKCWLILLTLAYSLSDSSAAFAESSCPKSFAKFVELFGDDRSFQEAHTKYPLKYISNNGQGSCIPDCPTKTDSLSKEKALTLTEPIFPLSSTQAMGPLIKKIKRSKNQISVRIDKPDSDSFSFEFIFKRSSTCWQLVSAEDISI
jgi:hypothetical protein